MECCDPIEAHRLYRRASYHDSHHPEESSQVAQLPLWVIEGNRLYKKEHRTSRVSNCCTPLITLVPSDGIVDQEAVDRAVRGLPVTLRPIEASLAIMQMHALDMPRRIIAARFGMRVGEASRFCPIHGGWGAVDIAANWQRSTVTQAKSRALRTEARKIRAHVDSERAKRQER